MPALRDGGVAERIVGGGIEIERAGRELHAVLRRGLVEEVGVGDGSAYTTPKLRVWLCSASSPAYSAFFPASCLPMNSAAFIAPTLTSVCAHRYGACFNVASSEVVFREDRDLRRREIGAEHRLDV